jgi:vacuolar protein sorting-associated protein VTA1
MPAPAQSSKKQTYVVDDMAMAKAQKHAKFAISALTFDDPDTAVKELRAAL